MKALSREPDVVDVRGGRRGGGVGSGVRGAC